MFRLLHHGLCVSLSAALLLTNGLPMAVQHAHPVGKDLSHHTHAGAVGGDVHASHRESVPVFMPASLTEVTEHIHLLWLGMEFTLPAPKGPAPDTSVSAAGAYMLARLSDQGASDVDSTALTLVLTECDLAYDASIGVYAPTTSFGPPRQLAALPLCDLARHARSGVQLI